MRIKKEAGINKEEDVKGYLLHSLYLPTWDYQN